MGIAYNRISDLLITYRYWTKDSTTLKALVRHSYITCVICSRTSLPATPPRLSWNCCFSTLRGIFLMAASGGTTWHAAPILLKRVRLHCQRAGHSDLSVLPCYLRLSSLYVPNSMARFRGPCNRGSFCVKPKSFNFPQKKSNNIGKPPLLNKNTHTCPRNPSSSKKTPPYVMSQTPTLLWHHCKPHNCHQPPCRARDCLRQRNAFLSTSRILLKTGIPRVGV